MKLSTVAQRSFVLLPAHWPVRNAMDYLKGLSVSHVIVARDDGPGYHYLYRHQELRQRLQHSSPEEPLMVALGLAESGATATRDGETELANAPARVVVTDHGHVIGFLDAVALAPSEPVPVGVEPPTDTGGTPRSGGATRGPRRRTFSAFPRVDVPETIQPAAAFSIVVGFRSDPDPRLSSSGPSDRITLRIADDDTCLVVLSADGLTLDRDHDELPLKQNAAVVFTATPRAGVQQASLKVQYFYENQLIGTFSRDLAIGEPPATVPAVPAATAAPVSNPCRLTLPGPGQAVDLTVFIRYDQAAGTLSWRLSAPTPRIDPNHPPLVTRIDNAPAFAADLINDLKDLGHGGVLAAATLRGKGQTIADAMPPELFTALKAVHTAVGRTPTVLLLTNELYVPWELAFLAEPLDEAAPPFLAAQTQLGRWLEDERVVLPPPVELEIKRITAVAGNYALESGLRELPEALAEREVLQRRWSAQTIEPTRPDMATMITGQRLPGHLVHFAVHGVSDPQNNNQSLLLADATRLPAEALGGTYRCGETPRFSFIFLNACQVGSPGETLGQAGGFPGTLVRRGAQGFIAPLWEVDDRLARTLAELFYEQTLDQERPVAATLQRLRAGYRDEDSTTPLAYIYYGHPALRLEYAVD